MDLAYVWRLASERGGRTLMDAPRVLMFCPQFRPAIGGAERQAEKLAIALAASGCPVRILTPRIDADSPDLEEIQGVTIERFDMTDLSRRWPVSGIALVNIPFILWQVVRVVVPRLKQVDLLHTHLASLVTLGAVLSARLVGKPALCKAAMADHRSDLGEIEKQGLSGRLVAWLTRKAVPCWVATTRAVQDALVRGGVHPERIVQIPNGIRLPKKIPIRRKRVRRFLYLGRLSTNINRDIPTLIAAFERLADEIPDAELGIVGGGDLLDETRKQVLPSTVSPRIHIPGFDIAEHWLAWADCFVLPSRREGLSNALLEAMAEGLPCIANDIPPNREVLADGASGLLVPIGDVDALTNAMRDVANDDALAKSLHRAAFLRASQHYGIEAVAERYISLYSCQVFRGI